MKKFFKILALIILLGSFIGGFYYLYAKSQKPPEIFKTTTAAITTIAKKTVATGSITPRKEIFIKPQVSGIVEKVFVLAGKMVKAGDVIAQVRIIPNMINLNEAESRLNRAKIGYDNAKIDFDRNKILFEQGVVPKADLQRFEVTLKNTNEELESAESNLQLIKNGVAKRSGQATNTLIRSTISGMLLDVPVKEGSSVIEANNFNEGTTIASVADMGEMIFDGKVDESEVGKIKTGMDLVLTVGAIDNKKFKAKLEYIAPKGVTENGAIQFQIKAAIVLDTTAFLRAGYSGNADIILEQKDSILCVPESVITFSNDSAYLEVEQAPQVFVKRYIKTGLSDGINIEVLDGVTKTDKIKLPQTVNDNGVQQ
jgi:HlyD family secretion protein